MSGQRGRFIAFEGVEGCGKSTQVERLADVLRVRYGREVVVTREPGGTGLGKELRQLLLGREVMTVDDGVMGTRRVGPKIGHRAELLMMLADRAQHVDDVIVPALNAGAVVISDRHAASSVAYQGAARGLGEALVRELSMFATGSLQPDLTVLLDLDEKVALGRARSRGDANRFEAEHLQFHRAVRLSFIRQAMNDMGRWAVITVAESTSVNQVSEQVEWAVSDRLGLTETGWVDVAARR